MKVCIYTACAGDYEKMKPILSQSIPCDWIAFTEDERGTEYAGWTWMPLRYNGTKDASPRLRAKWYKVLPWMALPGYEYTIWIDSSVTVTSPTFAEDMLGYLDGFDLAAFRHPYRTGIYSEAMVSVNMPKYQGQRLIEQVKHYSDQGYPADGGLWCGTVIARHEDPGDLFAAGILPRRDSALLHEWMQRWWEEILEWSLQDQLSLPYVSWVLGVQPHVIPGNLYDGKWFTVQHQPEAL